VRHEHDGPPAVALAADSAEQVRDPGQEERVFVVPAEPARDGA